MEFSEPMTAADHQKDARFWYERISGAKWDFDSYGFSGYVSQWIRWYYHIAHHTHSAMELRGITEDDQIW